ncbi:MAG TPA: hypothetical protein GXX69_05470 [Firmicutes bacterium]|jgi:hypothetical protein|nr:hypothetical protein [Bacillota bacterium]
MVLFFPWSLVALSWLFFVLIGFAWGRRWGRNEGLLLGQREAPLLLRKASLLNGRCVICQQDTIQPLPEPISSPLAYD